MAENILLFQIGGEVRFALQISQLFIGCTALIIITVIVVITINAIIINAITIIFVISMVNITIVINIAGKEEVVEGRKTCRQQSKFKILCRHHPSSPTPWPEHQNISIQTKPRQRRNFIVYFRNGHN